MHKKYCLPDYGLFERKDGWLSCSYFYIDKSENDLPPLELYKEIENIYGESFSVQNINLSSGTQYTRILTKKLYDITFNISCANKGSFIISVFGLKIHGDLDENVLNCLDNSAPLESFDGSIALGMLLDVSNIEIFINSGKAFMSIGHIQDHNLNHNLNQFVFKTIDKDVVIKEINIAEIKNIWNKTEGQ